MIKLLVASLLLMLVPVGSARGKETFVCNMAAMTKSERVVYQKLAQGLLGAVQERRELKDGYAFRLPAENLLTAAEWISFERRCCPFFAFDLEIARRDGPLWLRVTGSQGIKAFIRAEFGFETAR
ncbi:MAG: hypothetical protein ABIU54_00745 [Candidatus Eisenbacteria bacterium]